MQRREFLSTASAATLALAGLAGCGSPGPGGDGERTETTGDGSEGTETGTETEASTETPVETDTATTTEASLDLERQTGTVPEGLEVSNTDVVRSDQGGGRVTGTVENTGSSAVEEVEVQVTLLDANDEILGQFFHDTRDNDVDSLQPGQSWEFAVSFEADSLADAVAYRVDVDTTIDEGVEIPSETETGTGTP